MRKDVEEIKQKLSPLLERYGIKKAGLFGSIARGDNKKDSDVDLLVEVEKPISLLDFIKIKLEIEKILGREVDLVEYDTIKPLLKERILNEEIRII